MDAMDGFTWLSNEETGGFWQCPNGLLDELLPAGEWQVCEAPPEFNPATAEHAAWREAQAAAAEPQTPKPTRTPRSGESSKE